MESSTLTHVEEEVEVTTSNKNLGEEAVDISASVTLTLPASVQEAIDFFDGEEKFMQSVRADVKRRKINAARQVLRESDKALDWNDVAQRIAEGYQPGRRGGFGAVAVDESELAAVAQSGDFDALKALLASKGVSLG